MTTPSEDYFARLMAANAPGPGEVQATGNGWFAASGGLAGVAFVMTAVAFSNDGDSGLGGLILFVTGPVFVVSFVLAVIGLALAATRPTDARHTLDEILRTSNGTTAPTSRATPTASAEPRDHRQRAGQVMRAAAVGSTVLGIGFVVLVSLFEPTFTGYAAELLGAPLLIIAMVCGLRASQLARPPREP